MIEAARVEERLARAWLARGRQEPALLHFQRSLELDQQAHVALDLARLYLVQQRPERAISVLLATLRARPENPAEVHKLLCAALVAHGGWEAARDHYGLQGDERPLAGEVLVVSVIYNEAPRLAAFLSHYRRLGAAGFLMVDNGSNDGGPAFLRAQSDVRLWSSTGSFHDAHFGSAWFEVLLRRYGLERWCLVVDADELLLYTDCEQRSLPELCWDLQAQGKRAMTAVLLDIYAEQPIHDTRLGEEPLDDCPFCDHPFSHRRIERAGPYGNQTIYLGGVRQRVFGEVEYYLSKVPLIRYGPDVVLSGGQHFTNLAQAMLAEESGALMHLKYGEHFPALAQEQVERGEHYGGAEQYQVYARKLAAGPLSLYDPTVSVRWRDSQNLIDLGVIQAGPQRARPLRRFQFPAQPVRPGVWVGVTVYRRLDYLARALESVLNQPDDDLTLCVIQDGGVDEATQAEARRLVTELGQGRVEFLASPQRWGQPVIFNACVERADREWIHLLHDDDWVEAGFYRQMRTAASAEAGMVFCRHRYVDREGRELRLSALESEQAGTLENWLDRIGVFCRIQTPAVLVRRGAYERLGGYRPQAASAFDWDMWKRLAAEFPVCYEPRILAAFREHPASLSGEYLESGRQLADSLRSIELTRPLLGPGRTALACGAYARYGLELARRFRAQGRLAAVAANLRQVLRLDESAATVQAVRELLA